MTEPADLDNLLNSIFERMGTNVLLPKKDLDHLIAMYRKARANRAAGVKVKKAKDESPTDLMELLNAVPKTQPTNGFKRRF